MRVHVLGTVLSATLMLLLFSLSHGVESTAIPKLEGVRYEKERNVVLRDYRDGILYLLDNRNQEAINLLDRAEYNIQKLRPPSVTENVSAFLMSPNQKSFVGEDFEQAFVNYYQALAYYQMGNIDTALVEARQLNFALKETNRRYDQGTKNRYTADPAMHVFQAMLDEVVGRQQDALVSYRQARKEYRDRYTSLTGVQEPAFVANVIDSGLNTHNSVPSTGASGALLILYESGLSPRKSVHSEKIVVPCAILPKDIRKSCKTAIYVNMKTPKFTENRSLSGQLRVTLPNGEQAITETLTDLDALARVCLDDRLKRIKQAAAVRVVLKKAALSKKKAKMGKVIGGILGSFLSKQRGPSGDADRMGDAVAEMITQGVIDYTERPDIRSVAELPRTISGTRIRLPAGTYNLVFEELVAGRVVHSYTRSVTIKPGIGTLVWNRGHHGLR